MVKKQNKITTHVEETIFSKTCCLNLLSKVNKKKKKWEFIYCFRLLGDLRCHLVTLDITAVLFWGYAIYLLDIRIKDKINIYKHWNKGSEGNGDGHTCPLFAVTYIFSLDIANLCLNLKINKHALEFIYRDTW